MAFKPNELQEAILTGIYHASRPGNIWSTTLHGQVNSKHSFEEIRLYAAELHAQGFIRGDLAREVVLTPKGNAFVNLLKQQRRG
jgi:predicted transcriptional regulator